MHALSLAAVTAPDELRGVVLALLMPPPAASRARAPNAAAAVLDILGTDPPHRRPDVA
jgi:hypothetical protein